MAKRRRLDPVPFLVGEGLDMTPEMEEAPALAAAPDPEPPPSPVRPVRARAPIAQVAGGAAAAAALDEVSETLRAAREEGRLVVRLPLDAVEAGHLARDRLAAEAGEPGDLSRAKGAEAMQELTASLRARGQQAPVEVVELPPAEGGAPRWGLVSGWRRLTALRALHAETGEARFGTVLALVRRPASAAETYVAMVEENEIREDLSFWERARIVRRAVDAGAFADETEALRALFASASYARRSKIKSFLPVIAALEGAVRFPEAIGERLGLALARALAESQGFAERARRALGEAAPADAAGEGELLGRLLAEDAAPPQPERAKTPSSPSGGDAETKGYAPRAVAGLTLRGRPGRIEIRGEGASAELLEALEAWLRDR